MGPKLKITLIGLLVLWAAGATIMLYQYSQNGRYQFKEGSSKYIIDTRTGATYQADKYSGDTKLISRGVGEERP
jgi:hypothetical protein